MLPLLLALVAVAQAAPQHPVQTPGEIVAAAKPGEWTAIAPDDLLVMDLAPAANGAPRRVVIQLMPPPFSQGWIANIRTLARAHWWDGTSVNRVQDNYVAQWGDANGEDKAKAKPLPAGLRQVPESEYTATVQSLGGFKAIDQGRDPGYTRNAERDAYAEAAFHLAGWQIAGTGNLAWPVHCYGMVGVGRDMPPDTGTGAELYAVIGHAPRHLDRNIALVGRIVEGIEYLSSLPRGTGDLGFYKTAAERTPIRSVRLASELPATERPHLQYLSTGSASFARYADARANRRDAFFIHPAGGADICNVPVPIRRAP